MKTVTQRAFARAGLLGNPSDGYHGKTISIIVRNFFAQVDLAESDQLTIIPHREEVDTFDSIDDLTDHIAAKGYYGGVRLLKAAIKRFCEYCRLSGQTLQGPKFSVRYSSNIPRQVGLAGSSAIVTAMLRGLMEWFDVDIHDHLLASLSLAAESDLGIPAGLQDRVIQAYEGVLYMDFDKTKMQTENGLTFGVYEQLDPRSLPLLYIAINAEAGEPTEVLHNDLKQRFAAGDAKVVATMKQLAELAERGVEALHRGKTAELNSLMNQNFDLRQSICQLNSKHVQMVQIARHVGASAKYCGSGGATIGIYSDESTFENLVTTMQTIGCEVFKPIVLNGS